MVRLGLMTTCLFAVLTATAYGQSQQGAPLSQDDARQQSPRLLSQRISGQRISNGSNTPEPATQDPQPARTSSRRGATSASAWGALSNRQTEGGLRSFTPRHLRSQGNVAQVAFEEEIVGDEYVAQNIPRGMRARGRVAPMPGNIGGEGFVQPGGCDNCGNMGCSDCGQMGCAECGDFGCASGPIGCDTCGGFGGEACGCEPTCGAGPGCGCGGQRGMGRREFNSCPLPTPWCRWRDLEIGVGVHAFKNAINLGADGSFGVQQWANYGFLAPCFPAGVSGQLGFRTTQSNFYGASFTNDSRQQLFITGGFFRRADWGLQGGIVFDYLIDDWQINTRLQQIRAEVSWAYPTGTDIGFWGTRSLNTDNNTAQFSVVPRGFTQNQNFNWRSSDVYSFFVRKRTKSLAEGRLMLGFTDQSKFMVGGDYSLPVTERVGFGASAIFFLPDASRGDFRGVQDEEWNLSFNVIYYPGSWKRVRKSYNRPLLPVAGNDSFFVTRLTP